MEPPENSVQCESQAAWREWLAQNHERPTGIWLVTFKKAFLDRYLSYDAAVEEAMCFGWVDSKPGKVDEARTMLWFAPRKPGSLWSRPNKIRVEQCIADGRMTEAGMRKIEASKADGTWTKLDDVENLVVPDDLVAALDSLPDAAANFDAFPRSAKRGILEWILQAKRPDSRAARIAETARLAAENRRANQWKGPKPNP